VNELLNEESRPARRPPWALLLLLVLSLAVVYGGFSTFGDQRSGTPGTATVTECDVGNTKYNRAIHCRGTWTAGGSLLEGGRVVAGPIQGAGPADVGKTLSVRVHGSDHATVPRLTTPIVLWALGGSVALLCLLGLARWWRAA
jgi:hypothetical protein